MTEIPKPVFITVVAVLLLTFTLQETAPMVFVAHTGCFSSAFLPTESVDDLSLMTTHWYQLSRTTVFPGLLLADNTRNLLAA